LLLAACATDRPVSTLAEAQAIASKCCPDVQWDGELANGHWHLSGPMKNGNGGADVVIDGRSGKTEHCFWYS